MPTSTRSRLGRPPGGKEKLWREAAISWSAAAVMPRGRRGEGERDCFHIF
jgi:hypothetical protein